MAKRTSQRKKAGKPGEKRAALTLVGVLAAALLCSLALAVPGFSQWVFAVTGVTPGALLPVKAADSPVAVHFIDVGQGAAVLVEDNGEFALVDAGPPEGADALTAYLNGAGVRRLRCAVLTHPHADHYGGMQKVIENFTVELMVLPVMNQAPYPTASAFLSLLAALEERGVAAEEAAQGNVYPIGEGEIRVIHTGLPTDDNYNLLSLGLLYSGGGLRFLATGDGEKANERAMLESGESLYADLFFAAHHGSSTSNSKDFLQAVDPWAVVISCAAGNSYGHPHESPLEAFEEAGARVYRTDKSGSVIVQPAPGALAVATAKNTL